MNGITCSYAKDIAFRNVAVASQNQPYAEDHVQNIQKTGWKEITLPADAK